jgi:Mrp family chromosome partitioning ATPase
LVSGPPPPNPVEILSAPRLKRLIDSYSQEVRVFIVDTPPSTQWADAQIIAGQTGFALFVAREDVTKLSDLKRSKSEIEAYGVDVLGIIYNKPPKNVQSRKSVAGESWLSRLWHRLTRK